MIEIARMAEAESRALDRAFRALGDGALVGPAATRLWEDLARRHAKLRQAFVRAFASAEAIAAQGDRPPPRVAMPYLRPAPAPPPRREIVGGDPDLIEILATEVTRAGRSWEDAGSGLRTILNRIGADPSPGVAISVAGDWVGAERRDLLHRRADLLKQVELDALEGGYGEFIPGNPGADGPTRGDGARQGAAGGSAQRPDAATTLSAAASAALGGGAAAALGGTSAGAAGGAGGARGGSRTAGAALRALMARLDPVDQMVRRLEATMMPPHTYVTRGLSTRLDRMGLPALAGSLTSLERDGRSFLLGVGESSAGLAKQVWAATPVGAAINRGFESSEIVMDPVGYQADRQAELEGLIWGAQHPIEFAKAAADWETLKSDPARWTGRMTPDALLSAAGGGGLIGRTVRGLRHGAKGSPGPVGPPELEQWGRAVETGPSRSFRGDTRPPGKIFEEGFRAKGESTDLERFAKYDIPSRFISTARTLKAALPFAGMKGWVYEIEGHPGPVVDVNRALGWHYRFMLWGQAEKELAMLDRILPEHIKLAWEVRGLTPTGTVVPNPAFKGGPAP